MSCSDNPGGEPGAIFAEVREGEYGASIRTVEPGGAEFIPLTDRHGTPWQLFRTWMSPNLEFSTVFIGVISVWFFGLTVTQAIIACFIGTALGSLTHGFLSSRGPLFGVPEMIISRIPFGFRGNLLPAGLNAVIAGVGWFAVNSVSGTFALHSLTGLPNVPSLIIVILAQVAVAYMGHNFLQSFERWVFPLLAVAFILAFIWVVPAADVGFTPETPGGLGGILIVVGASFGYAAGWNPFASDYTRYLAPTVNRKTTGLAAGLGILVSCVLLEALGAFAATLAFNPDDPTGVFIEPMPTLVGKFVLLAIILGSICANAINLYSGSMSFLSLGFNLHASLRRTITTVVFGVLGGLLALYGLENVHVYENFLLVIAYWVGPWLGVVFMDWILRKGHRVDGFMFDHKHTPWGGWVAMLVAMVVSIWGFSNQVQYVGPVPTSIPALGDIAFEVGFVLAAVLYLIFFKLQKQPTDEVLIIPDSAVESV
ncbi:MAG: cytosine permease [Actinobacteria bacterium]|nr:cytosine permease [Actinomycetota bacterium]